MFEVWCTELAPHPGWRGEAPSSCHGWRWWSGYNQQLRRRWTRWPWAGQAVVVWVQPWLEWCIVGVVVWVVVVVVMELMVLPLVKLEGGVSVSDLAPSSWTR